MTGGPADDGFEMGFEADGADIVARRRRAVDAVSYAGAPPVSPSASVTARATTARSARATTSAASSSVEGGKAGDIISPDPGLDRRPVRLRRRRRRRPDRRERPRPPDRLGRGRLHDLWRRRGHADRQRRRARDDRLRHQPARARPTPSRATPSETSIRNCENSEVGKLSLKARGSTVDVSWTHPEAWKQLRSITVRVLDAQREIGTVKINPRAGKLAATGAVELGRKSALTRGGQDRLGEARAEGRQGVRRPQARVRGRGHRRQGPPPGRAVIFAAALGTSVLPHPSTILPQAHERPQAG